MAKYSNSSKVEEIKSRLSIVELIQNYITLKKSGKNYLGLCPFHDDNNPSMFVNDEKGLFHCFSCGEGGDAFGFLMRYKNIDFMDALRELAHLTNVGLERINKPQKSNTDRNIYYKLNNLVAEFYHKNLKNHDSAKSAREYINNRHLSDEIVDEFKIGFSQDKWDGLVKHLHSRNVPNKLSEKAGLVVKNKNGEGYYDRFRNRIMFPIMDVDGKIIAFGGRVISEDQPKYLNSPESIIYHKSRSFYGMDKSKDHIRRSGIAILVEGYMDFLTLYSHGIKNVVASLGTAFTTSHASLLKRYTNNIVVVFDGDKSGLKATLRVLDVFMQEGIIPKMVDLSGDDPDSYVSSNGRDAFNTLIKNSRTILDYFLENLLNDFKNGIINASDGVNQILEIVNKINNPIEKSRYIKNIAEDFGLRESELYNLSKASKKLNRKAYINYKSDTGKNEKTILKIISKYPECISLIENEVNNELHMSDEIDLIIKEIVNSGQFKLSYLLEKFNSEKFHNIITESVMMSDDLPDYDGTMRILKNCIKNLKVKDIEISLKKLRIDIENAINNKDSVLENKLMKEFRDLTQRNRDMRREVYEH